jgi:hypothetical protein
MRGICSPSLRFRVVSQLLWSDKDREEWFSLGENNEEACGFGGANCETALAERKTGEASDQVIA